MLMVYLPPNFVTRGRYGRSKADEQTCTANGRQRSVRIPQKLAGKEARVCLSNRDDLPISPGKRFDRPVLVRCFLQASRSATTPKSDREKYSEKKATKLVDIFVSILGESRTYPNYPKFNSLSPALKVYENSSLVYSKSSLIPAHSCRCHAYRSRRGHRWDCIGFQPRSREAAHERRRDERRVHQRLHLGHGAAVHGRGPDGLFPEPRTPKRTRRRGRSAEPRCDRRQFERLLRRVRRERLVHRGRGRLDGLLPLRERWRELHQLAHPGL